VANAHVGLLDKRERKNSVRYVTLKLTEAEALAALVAVQAVDLDFDLRGRTLYPEQWCRLRRVSNHLQRGLLAGTYKRKRKGKP
jgi:hypothetical protein